MIAALLLSGLAAAQIAPECEEAAAADPPSWYVDDAHQQAFLLNYFALSTSLSPQHAAIPAHNGHGSMGVDLAIIPPLNCNRRLVLDRSKTEDTNKAPVVPRIRLTFAMPKVGPVVFYGGLAYAPPVQIFGTQNVIASGEIGAGMPMKSGAQVGLRYHYSLLKTVAEIATPFSEDEPTVLDFYSGSTFGLDLMGGWDLGKVTPYVALGFTDASTFFYIGDDGLVSNNPYPFFGFNGSLGVQARVKFLDLAAELYAVPGQLYTGRVRVGYLF